MVQVVCYIAHAYFPGQGDISGDAHFDAAEAWSVTPYRGIQLLNTLTHEIGHSLGLEHSRVPGYIMAPQYKGWDADLRLVEDDIKGIQYLYGKPQYFPSGSDDKKLYDPITGMCGHVQDNMLRVRCKVIACFRDNQYCF